ncbi:MAG TPA: hypothetical protein VFB38_00965 [Chthonomonadaceae bacterium]|nr:hypothetical protein [Chthonomonadaceae bacterium]
MRDFRGLDHPGALQFNLLRANMIEQSYPAAEQYGHKMKLYFVKQPGTQSLLNDTRAACYRDIFVTCGCFRLL